MDRDAKQRNRIPGWLKAAILLLILIAFHYGRTYYDAYRHPYKDLDIIGTWDYEYSVTFDVDNKTVRSDRDQFSLEMYMDTEVIFNDDGTFSISIEDEYYTGTWQPDQKNSKVFYVTLETDDNVIDCNEIRWDRTEDKIFFGLRRDKIPVSMSGLFNDGEEYREVFCKTQRDNDDDHWHFYGIGE